MSIREEVKEARVCDASLCTVSFMKGGVEARDCASTAPSDAFRSRYLYSSAFYRTSQATSSLRVTMSFLGPEIQTLRNERRTASRIHSTILTLDC